MNCEKKSIFRCLFLLLTPEMFYLESIFHDPEEIKATPEKKIAERYHIDYIDKNCFLIEICTVESNFEYDTCFSLRLALN